jgi:cyclophilin family peptidyl-prolyl cis-trans isomerase
MGQAKPVPGQPASPWPCPAPGRALRSRRAWAASCWSCTPDKSPATVANFLAYVRDGHYNGTVFHRVVADFLLQGGDYTPDLQQKPERAPIRNEANNGLSNLRGTISAARKSAERDSARSQFFINTVDNRQLDYRGEAPPASTGYCVFGRVVEGMDVVDKIRVVATGPPRAVRIRRAGDRRGSRARRGVATAVMSPRERTAMTSRRAARRRVSTLFVSDLHLDAARPEATALFLAFPARRGAAGGRPVRAGRPVRGLGRRRRGRPARRCGARCLARGGAGRRAGLAGARQPRLPARPATSPMRPASACSPIPRSRWWPASRRC